MAMLVEKASGDAWNKKSLNNDAYMLVWEDCVTCALGRHFLAPTVYETSANDSCAVLQLLIFCAHNLERSPLFFIHRRQNQVCSSPIQSCRVINSVRVRVCADSEETTSACAGRCVRPPVLALTTSRLATHKIPSVKWILCAIFKLWCSSNQRFFR